MKKKYDIVIPFGCGCQAAAQLRARGLRLCSFPLDWVGFNAGNCGQLVQFLETRFAGFLQEENLSVVRLDGGDRKIVVGDAANDLTFPHDFRKGNIGDKVDPEELVEVSAKYTRRINRLYEVLAASKSILFVCAFRDDVVKTSDADIQAFHQKMRELLPMKDVDLFTVRYESSCYKTLELSDSVIVQDTPRTMNIGYDTQCRMPEYWFLDEVTLSGANMSDFMTKNLKEGSFFEKAAYRLTKWLMKFLRDRKMPIPGILNYN